MFAVACGENFISAAVLGDDTATTVRLQQRCQGLRAGLGLTTIATSLVVVLLLFITYRCLTAVLVVCMRARTRDVARVHAP